MTTYTNSDIGENLLPALQALGERELKPLGNLRVYRVRKAFLEHWSAIEAVRREILKQHATPDKNGKIVLDIAGNAIFDQDPLKAAKQQLAFIADLEEVLAGTFDFDLTISLEEHIGENIPPANVLLGLGKLLVLPKEPGEPEGSEPEVADADRIRTKEEGS